MNNFQRKVRTMGGCGKGVEFISIRVPQKAWEECQDPSWLLWWADKMAGSPGWKDRAEVARVALSILKSELGKDGLKDPPPALTRFIARTDDLLAGEATPEKESAAEVEAMALELWRETDAHRNAEQAMEFRRAMLGRRNFSYVITAPTPAKIPGYLAMIRNRLRPNAEGFAQMEAD